MTRITPHFVDTDPKVTDALAEAFAQWSDVTVTTGRFEDLVAQHPAMIAAGNSFGVMDGGIDLAIRNHFGIASQEAVQAMIRRDHAGVMPVGSAAVVPMPGATTALIYAPTMVVPGAIPHTFNVYLAFKGALVAAARAGLSSVLCSGLGTLTGRMHPRQAAYQMALAHRHVIEPPVMPDWAAVRHVWDAMVRGTAVLP